MKRELGLLLPTRQVILSSVERPPLEQCWQMARLADEHGLDGVWVGDSITARARLEPLTTLAYLAAITRRVTVGAAVLLPALRQPIPLAHSLFTLDQIAEGRLIVGVGAGSAAPDNEAEAAAVGISLQVRGRRVDEALAVFRDLTKGEPVTREGSGYRLEGITVGPLPYRRSGLKIWVTCGNAGQELPAQLPRLAQFGDGLIAIRLDQSDVRQLKERLRPALAELGRDLDAMDLAVYCDVRIDPDRSRAEQALLEFLHAYYGRPISIRGSATGPTDEVVRSINGFWDAGVTQVIVRFPGADQIAQTELFLRDVWPQLRRAG